jgi:putative transcriptional regulator
VDQGRKFQLGIDDYSFTGKLLVAMPYMSDPRFSHAVIFVCGHDEKGTMGIIINKPLPTVSFHDLMEQLGLTPSTNMEKINIHYGGPVEIGRGFVLHTDDYVSDSTVIVDNGFALTATLDILRALASDRGPQKAILALGYVGWGAGQLEREIQENGWISIEPTPEIVFSPDLENKWVAALASIGVNPAILSLESGHA